MTAQDDWQHWYDRFGKIRNGMIRLFHDRAIWRTILAMLHASPGVARGSFGEPPTSRRATDRHDAPPGEPAAQRPVQPRRRR